MNACQRSSWPCRCVIEVSPLRLGEWTVDVFKSFYVHPLSSISCILSILQWSVAMQPSSLNPHKTNTTIPKTGRIGGRPPQLISHVISFPRPKVSWPLWYKSFWATATIVRQGGIANTLGHLFSLSLSSYTVVMQWTGRNDCQLQMNRLSLGMTNWRLRLHEKLPIIWRELIHVTEVLWMGLCGCGQTTSKPPIHRATSYGLRNCLGRSEKNSQWMEKSMFAKWKGWLFIPSYESICVGFWRFLKFPKFCQIIINGQDLPKPLGFWPMMLETLHGHCCNERLGSWVYGKDDPADSPTNHIRELVVMNGPSQDCLVQHLGLPREMGLLPSTKHAPSFSTKPSWSLGVHTIPYPQFLYKHRMFHRLPCPMMFWYI